MSAKIKFQVCFSTKSRYAASWFTPLNTFLEVAGKLVDSCGKCTNTRLCSLSCGSMCGLVCLAIGWAWRGVWSKSMPPNPTVNPGWRIPNAQCFEIRKVRCEWSSLTCSRINKYIYST